MGERSLISTRANDRQYCRLEVCGQIEPCVNDPLHVGIDDL